jgi:hypothetical protein
MAGVRPGEARAISWEEDVDLYGNPPSVAVLRAIPIAQIDSAEAKAKLLVEAARLIQSESGVVHLSYQLAVLPR